MKKTLSRLPRVVRLAALSAVLLALCSKSSPLYAFNDWMDANIFFTMGRSMLGGRVLYRDVFDHKGRCSTCCTGWRALSAAQTSAAC